MSDERRANSLRAVLIGVVAGAGLFLLALPSAALDIASVFREVSGDAFYGLDSSYYYTSDSDYEYDQTSEVGLWNRSYEARTYAYEGAPDGIGRVDLVSQIGASGYFSFDSRLFTQGGFYNTEGGDPADEGSYYYTNEESGGTAGSHLRMRFYLSEATSYQAMLGSATHNISAISGFTLELTHVSSLPIEIPGFLINQLIFDESSLPAGGLSGVLARGLYDLEISHSASSYSANSSGESDMQFLMVVPEPGTALLLGFGLVTLASMRRGPRNIETL